MFIKKIHIFLILGALAWQVTGCSSSSDSSDDANNNGAATDGSTTAGGGTTDGTTTDGSTTDGTTTDGTTTDGTTTGGGTISGDVTQWGVVDVSVESSENEIDVSAGFFQFNANVPGNVLGQSFNPPLDTCEVTQTEPVEPGEFEIPDIEGITAQITTISAGETIQLTSSAGTFAELQRETISGFTFYRPTVDSIAGPIPGDLILDIPGDVFPMFANVAIPNVGGFVLTEPASGVPVTPASAFAWNAGTDPNSFVSIEAVSLDISTGTSLIVDCVVADDGAFAFPAATQAEMGAGFVSSFGVDAEREAVIILQQAGAVLVVVSASGD